MQRVPTTFKFNQDRLHTHNCGTRLAGASTAPLHPGRTEMLENKEEQEGADACIDDAHVQLSKQCAAGHMVWKEEAVAGSALNHQGGEHHDDSAVDYHRKGNHGRW
jgi:hypothetical protein